MRLAPLQQHVDDGAPAKTDEKQSQLLPVELLRGLLPWGYRARNLASLDERRNLHGRKALPQAISAKLLERLGVDDRDTEDPGQAEKAPALPSSAIAPSETPRGQHWPLASDHWQLANNESARRSHNIVGGPRRRGIKSSGYNDGHRHGLV